MRENHRILGRDCVELLTIGEFLFRPECVVPPAAADPFAVFVLSHTLRKPFLQFGNALHTIQSNGKPVCACPAEMHMRIVESGHHKMFFEVHHPRAFICNSGNLIVVAYRENLVTSHQHGIRPRRRRIVCIDVAVAIDSDGCSSRRYRKRLRDAAMAKYQPRNQSRGDNSPSGSAERTHRALSSTMPEVPSSVSSTRCSPISRPSDSYHSCSE